MPPPVTAVDAPGPFGLPRIGNVPAFLRDKLGFLSRCAADYGDVVRLEIGGRTYLLRSPEDIKHVLVTNADNYEKTPRIISGRARRFFGDGLVTRVGREHLRQRRLLQPLFHRTVIDRFAARIIAEADQMLEAWHDGLVLDVHQAMLDLTQRIIVRLLLGDEPQPLHDRFARAVSARRRYQERYFGSIVPFADLLPSRIRREYLRADADIDAIIAAAIARRRSGADPAGDVLAMLVHARYEDGTGMIDPLIRDEARTFALAGYETLAEALTWTWYLLAGSTAVEERLAAELNAIPAGRALAAADVGRLAYARMVLAEAIRLYPPTWVFVRVAREDDVLPCGVHVPAGSKIYLSQWVLHRDPRYFPDPERFDPERFSDEAMRARPRFTYLPFGAGRRLCIGEDFAWMEGVLLIAAVARRYRLTLVAGQSIAPEPNVTLRPRGGIRMRLERR